ncbi:response regulator [Rhizobium sp. GN54]|nr:response regulator [Rhizobium sp. GN54]
MPGEDGISICQQLRAAMTTPILFLTAVSERTDRIAGLEVDADDCLAKPFKPRELLARVRAALRGIQGASPRQRSNQGKHSSFRSRTLNFAPSTA